MSAMVRYEGCVDASATRRMVLNSLWASVCPITSLCPCSKEISDYGAHNQRGYVEIQAKSPWSAGDASGIWIDDLVGSRRGRWIGAGLLAPQAQRRARGDDACLRQPRIRRGHRAGRGRGPKDRCSGCPPSSRFGTRTMPAESVFPASMVWSMVTAAPRMDVVSPARCRRITTSWAPCALAARTDGPGSTDSSAAPMDARQRARHDLHEDQVPVALVRFGSIDLTDFPMTRKLSPRAYRTPPVRGKNSVHLRRPRARFPTNLLRPRLRTAGISRRLVMSARHLPVHPDAISCAIRPRTCSAPSGPAINPRSPISPNITAKHRAAERQARRRAARPRAELRSGELAALDARL